MTTEQSLVSAGTTVSAEGAELMEFKPVQKPCCSDFTAPHPTE